MAPPVGIRDNPGMLSSSPRRSGTALLVVGATLAGCQLVSGLDGLEADAAGSGGAGPSTSSATGGAPLCAEEGFVCAPAAPEGWQGPLRYTELTGEAPPPDCVGDGGAVGFVGLHAEPAFCSCSCGTSTTGAVCQATLSVWTASDTCAGPAPAPRLLPTGCNSVGAAGSFRVDMADAANCPILGKTEMVPDAQYDHHLAVCTALTLDTPTPCGDGGQCVAIPTGAFADRLCISQEGEHACPDAFPTKLLLHQSSEDDRGCTACRCSTCDQVYELFGDADCSLQTGTLLNGACHQNIASSRAPSIFVGPGSNACVPVGGKPTGSFQPAQPLTLCCAG